MLQGWQKFDQSYKARLLNEKFRKQEALKLYREVLRFCRLFTWDDTTTGLPWSALIKTSAREEFESSKQERDPEILARALVNGRFALDDLIEKYKQQQEKLKSQPQTVTIQQHYQQGHVPSSSKIDVGTTIHIDTKKE